MGVSSVQTAPRSFVATPRRRVQARPDGTIRTRLQEVFVKSGNDWSIASYHNVDIEAR
jgi:hypothetical protein